MTAPHALRKPLRGSRTSSPQDPAPRTWISAASHDRITAVALALFVFLVYNANGREIPSYDSQPTKYATRELLLRGTTSLNHVVGRAPALLERSAFVRTRDGRYRSAYSPVPSIAAAAIFWPLWKARLIDVRATLAPALMSKVAASLIVALAVALTFAIARRRISRGRALYIALAFGLGTGLWTTASQTLWQHESAILGLTLAVFGLTRDPRPSGLLVGLGLALACTARLQTAPAAVVLLCGVLAIGGRRAALTAAALAGAAVVALIAVYIRWFGHPLGAAPMLESLHGIVHGTTSSFRWQPEGFAGLLLSPSRGLLVFSPIVLFAFTRVGTVVSAGRRSPALWCLAAAAAQFTLYASYSVWWGGHTYGPRYVLDILPLLIPLAVAAAEGRHGRVAAVLAGAALAWSVSVAALGAFCFPHERWNSSPNDVDRNHARLWNWSDTQMARCLATGPSPQNFALLTRAAFRVTETR